MRRSGFFWWGWAGCAGALGLYQDVLGKEAYVRAVERHWLSGWWTIPLEVVVLVIAAVVLSRAHREDALL